MIKTWDNIVKENNEAMGHESRRVKVDNSMLQNMRYRAKIFYCIGIHLKTADNVCVKNKFDDKM